MTHYASALTIAGSDPSGGAGIQADLRVFSALRVAGLSAVTALTVQTSQGVESVHPVDADLLASQLRFLLDDVHPSAVKIGMLGTAEHVAVVADSLKQCDCRNVVLDPVLESSNGVSLLDSAGRTELLSKLLPLCDLITPNLPELVSLTGMQVGDVDSLRAAATELIRVGGRPVLVKGGHAPWQATDTLFQPGEQDLVYSGHWTETPHTHGTGCYLSSAIAALLAKGYLLKDAIAEAKSLLTRGLSNPVVTGSGRGYPDVAAAARDRPKILGHGYSERLKKLAGLYVITDESIHPGRSHGDIARAAIPGGANVIQLRDKGIPTRKLIRLVEGLFRVTNRAGALLIVNDRVDIAALPWVDGVHLGPDDMSPADARTILGADKLIGVSVSTVEEAQAAAPYASYFGVGSIFATSSKSDAGKPVGPERIREIKQAFPEIPLVAIGGISLENIDQVISAGAESAAVISAVVGAPDMEEATRQLCRRFTCS